MIDHVITKSHVLMRYASRGSDWDEGIFSKMAGANTLLISDTSVWFLSEYFRTCV